MKVLLPISTVFKLAFWLVVIAIFLGVVLGTGGGHAPAGATSASNTMLSLVVGTWRHDGGKGVSASCRRMSSSA